MKEDKKDVEKLKETGFDIDEIVDSGHRFEVYVTDPSGERRVKKFSKDDKWFDEIEYVDNNGDVREEMRWVKIMRDHINRHLDEEKHRKDISDLEKFEGDKL